MNVYSSGNNADPINNHVYYLLSSLFINKIEFYNLPTDASDIDCFFNNKAAMF